MNTDNSNLFPRGEELSKQMSQNFIGKAYLYPLSNNSELNCRISNVTFEPSCRNNWHRHSAGQILIVISGEGFYQEKGKEARLLKPGDIVEIPAHVEHWHGAAPNSWFSHLSLTPNAKENKTTWLDPVVDQQYVAATTLASTTQHEKPMGCAFPESWQQTDPELSTILNNWICNEVTKQGSLDTKRRIMVTMASSIAQNTVSLYKELLPQAYANNISPIEMKEIVYQSVAYCGAARVIDFVEATNLFLRTNNIELPLEGQSTTTPETRFEKGLAVQYDIFGKDHIDAMFTNAPKGQEQIPNYLASNCFGDYQTRTGLDKNMRELITFAMLISLGGCESQVKGHIQGNLNVGNNKEVLISTVIQLLPYIGYPRSLNAMRCINEVISE